MPKCTQTQSEKFNFGRIGRKQITANFDGGDLGSDGGLLLLKSLDEKLGLTRAAARAMVDPRNPDLIEHPMQSLIAQRVYALCCGYEDLNDHDRLRHDSILQTALGRDELLGSSPTLCRMENRTSSRDAAGLARVLFEQFIQAHAHASAPDEIVLDIDASDIPLYGDQEYREFHGYYDHYCYLPLYVFCGDHLLAAYLRNSRIDGAKNATALIKTLFKGIRAHWPDTRIVVRGDSGFSRQRLLRWCEKSGVFYVIGLARNERLQREVALVECAMKEAYEQSAEKQREIGEFAYAAQSWDIPRRVVTRLEYGAQGVNPRFIVSNLPASDYSAEALYDGLYCQRGEAENRIKETQLDLFGARASCQRFKANQFRTLLAALAYTLMQALKRHALAGTEFSRATSATIRSRLLKIGCAIMKNTRRIVLMLASAHPLRETFELAARRLNAMSALPAMGVP